MDKLRRTLILGGLVTPISGVAMATAFEKHAVSIDEFIGLSAKICAQSASSLNKSVAKNILAVLLQQSKGPAINKLINNFDGLSILALEIRSAWYSGIMDDGENSMLVAYDDALIWQANNFVHPAGTCGGITGYWSKPPEA